MSSPDRHAVTVSGWARRVTVALLVLFATSLVSLVPASAQRPNGAGLVIRHGDGTEIRAYVQFEEASITSEELLYRSGLSVVVAPFGGLGTAVCSIQGEGCPADNCFCESYSNPAFFWHFYAQIDGTWVEQLQGPSSRTISDGDVDGWSWTSGESGLPSLTIDEIAAINGVNRNPPEPTPTPTLTPEPPTNTPEPTATFTPVPTNTPVAVAPTPTPSPAIASTPSPTPSPEAQGAADATSTQAIATETSSASRPTQTQPPATRQAGTPSATPAATTPRSSPTSLPTITPSPGTTTVAVVVPPDGTPVPLDVSNDDDGGGSGSLLVFGGMVAVAAVAGVVVMLKQRVMT